MPRRRKKPHQATIQRRIRLKAARLVRALVPRHSRAPGQAGTASKATSQGPRLLSAPHWTS